MQEVGAFTQYIDFAQVVLYVFWLFFILLVLYLQKEAKREGYPLISDRSERILHQGYPVIPDPKTYRLMDGSTMQMPNGKNEEHREIKGTPIGPWPGAPLVPTGDPMVDGLGPSAWAEREDEPDMLHDGKPNIVPMKGRASDFTIASGSPDIRGCNVVALDDVVVGQITDLWINRADQRPYYYEVTLDSGRVVLIPSTLATLKKQRFGGTEGSMLERSLSRRPLDVRVASITSEQFENVPLTQSKEQITRLEEDKISAYFGGGHLWATKSRAEPLI